MPARVLARARTRAGRRTRRTAGWASAPARRPRPAGTSGGGGDHHPLQGTDEDVFADRLDVELARRRVVGGHPERRRAGSKGLEQGVEVEVGTVFESARSGLHLDEADRRLVRRGTAEGQVDHARQHRPARRPAAR